MDIHKTQEPRCKNRTTNFSEQFSDSSSNNDISRAQHSSRTSNSPGEEETCKGRSMDGDIDTVGKNTNGSSVAVKSPPSQQVPLNKVKSSINIRDEKDIKTEETSLSPQNISPVGIINNRDNDDTATPIFAKSSTLSPLPSGKGAVFFRNELQERSKSAGLVMPTINTSNFDGISNNANTNMSPKSNPEGCLGSNAANLPRNLNPFNSNLARYNCSTQEPTSTLNSGGVGNNAEYMQQQNHVFVFSTQLANKSAEAVLAGQFPTIIAYHCMQPSTKLFLEDFLKNPAKTTKLQRQYSLNIMNLMQSGLNRPPGAGGGQSYWLNECSNVGKLIQRPSNIQNVGVNKNSPGWNAAGVDSVASNQMDLLNNAEGFDNIPSDVCGVKVEDKSNIPSLQGVKVPDENLTPQQRQHREEQLAKLKKMNKFLFPENENDFHSSENNSLVPSDAVGKIASSEMLHNSSDVQGGTGNLGKQSISNLEILSASSESTNIGSAQSNKTGCASKMNPSKPNAITFRGQSDEQINTGLETNQDMMHTSFNMNVCPSSESGSVCGLSNISMSQDEWSKYQSNSLTPSSKGRHHSNPVQTSCGQTTMQQSTSLSRSLSMNVAGYGMQARPNNVPSPSNRNNNGPPPPYHQTQRSASVPIATQSPTHVSPNNCTTEMPMTSPQSMRVPFSVSSNVVETPSSINSNSTHLRTNAGLPSGNPKSIYSRDGTNICNPSQVYSHGANPPTTILSHMSPRDIDCIDNKQKASSPQQKCRSPLISDLQDNACMDPKYSNFGLNFPTCGVPVAVNSNLRHNMPSQFCRRIDNIPLNPNCNRVSQNKPVTNFDPIASLAQMSQQLTGSSGMGLNTMGTGNNPAAGIMDLNSTELMGGPSMRSSDAILDHCNQMTNNNIGNVGLAGALGRVTGQFAPDINNMNMLCGDTGLDQRMLNGKLCLPGNFNNALTGVGLRDTPVVCNEMTPSNHRALNRRMSTNFDHFNMSPNVHVKMSGPNTIQYMPARSQNLNSMRMTPSIEFFQRYANMGVGSTTGHINNDMGNPNMLHIFGNCNQMPPGMGQLGGRGTGSLESNDLETEGNLISNDAYMNMP